MNSQNTTQLVPILEMKSNILTKSELAAYLHQPKSWLNAVVITYTLIAYYGSLFLLLSSNGYLNAVGTLILCHSLVYAALFSHELLHGTVFKKRRLNELTAAIIRWQTGMCYLPFRQIVRGHIAHHLGKNYQRKRLGTALLTLPKPLVSLIITLEWFYFPVTSFLYLWRRNLSPFWTKQPFHKKFRVLAIILVRGTMFSFLGIASFKALCLYFLAYIMMITIVRFNQAFEHTSGYIDDPESQRSFTTFSPLISKRNSWLDILVLNFGYHNAHHTLMFCPWYHLPTLDKHIFQGNDEHHLGWSELLGNYHRFRITRLFGDSGQTVDEQGNVNLEKFYGVQAALPF